MGGRAGPLYIAFVLDWEPESRLIMRNFRVLEDRGSRDSLIIEGEISFGK